MNGDILVMRQRELNRLGLIKKAIAKQLTQLEASKLLGISLRQAQRIVRRVRDFGDKGIIHQKRGKPNCRRISEVIKAKVLRVYGRRYKDFGATLASEKLANNEGIRLSWETLRKWLRAEGHESSRRRRRKHRQWRERKAYCGEMVQMDGSHHDWLEGRGPRFVLMGYIDDATNRVYGRFYEYEGTIPAMYSFKRYVRKYGISISIYFDRHKTYKSQSEPTIEDEINGTEPLSEFGRALTELGVKLIHAYSPQAKGRIERQFKTLQDRLVKELRLRGISTIEEANKFLDKTFWADYNRRFMVKALHEEDIHRAIPTGTNLDEILCVRTDRPVRNDNTIAHNKKLYQLKESFPKKIKVRVEERVNGSMLIIYQGRRIKYSQIPVRPEKLHQENKKLRRSVVTPSASGNQPVRQSMEYLFKRQELRKRLRKAAA